MNAVPVDLAGVASGINNAVSRLASLISVAVFGLILLIAFDHNLRHRLDTLHVPTQQRQAIESQRSQLGAIQTEDPQLRLAIDRSFVFAFRRILWIAVALSLTSALSAQLLTSKRPASDPTP